MGTRRSRYVFAAVVYVALGTTRSTAQLPDVKIWRLTDTSTVVDLSIATSGGVSIGSYEAGMSWMFAELLKFLHDNPADRARFRLPLIRIAALSGASAGNVNSLLMALQSCDASPARPAETSALWDVWMQAGLEQLLPARRNGTPELGLFDRSFFNTVLKTRLREEFDRPARPECFIPIVSMMSKLLPSRLELNRFVGASVQRYVASYSVASEPNESADTWHFALRAPEPLVQRDTALGKQLALVSAHNDGTRYEFDQVFELLKASSSVVYFFAPTVLTYCDADAAADLGGCKRSGAAGARIKQARFVDGGVIDNAPLFSAMRLMTLRDSLTGAYEARSARREHGTLFVSYDARREHGAHAAPRMNGALHVTPEESPAVGCGLTGARERCGGLGAVRQFMSGLLTSSSQYELQWLIRLRSQSPTLRSLDVDVTTRYGGIVGERLKNASSFLGRPFREFDFQVGVYDALHYVASALLCLPEHRQPSDSLGPDQCIIHTVRGLVDRVPLSCPSSLAVDLLLRDEYGIQSSEGLRERQLRETAHCDDTSPESRERALAYRSVFEALQAVGGDSARSCSGRGAISSALCVDGTSEIFRWLGQDSMFVRYIEREAHACTRAVAATRSELERRLTKSRCFADREFLGALRDPERAFFGWVRRLLERAQWLEEDVAAGELDDDKLLGTDAVTQTASMILRSTLLAEDRGFIAFPTIVPPRRNAWRILTGLVIPREFAIEAIGSGSGYYWHPMAYRWASGFTMSTTAGVIRNTFASEGDLTTRTASQSRGTASLFLGYRPAARGRQMISSVYAGMRYWNPSRNDHDATPFALSGKVISPEVKASFLWDILSVRLTTNPGFGTVRERRRFRASLSFEDLGGFVYWILRTPGLR